MTRGHPERTIAFARPLRPEFTEKGEELKLAHAILAIVTALSFAALVVPQGNGANQKSSATRRPPALTTELRATQATLARATAQLARLNAGPGARTLERTLNRAKAQLSRAQLAAGPAPLVVATEQVRREVAWAQRSVAVPRAQLIAQAAMDYTVGHVSTGAFGYLELVKGSLPGYRPNRILAAQAGICGQAAWVFAALVRHFGLQVRSVTFSYDDPDGAPDGHTAVEVAYGGSWHYFDPTYGQFWTDASGNVLSILQVRDGLGTAVKDLAGFTNVVEDAWLANDTWFETASATEVQTGTLKLKG